MTKLLIDVKCKAKECGECEKMDRNYMRCGPFNWYPDLVIGGFLRLPACIAAEARAKRLKEEK